ncbi:MAG: cobalamin-binding protein [Wenzhouxiangellaceae bacterium]|nr:cobalamin-binding protein [Wenzhouxiangellaceae bacterium]
MPDAARPNHSFTRALAALLAGLLAMTAAAQTRPPERWISLAPHLTELVFAAGAGERLVGVVEWSDFPAAATELPRIGDAFRFDFERILRLQATHALAWAGGTPGPAIERLRELGLTVKVIETATLDAIGVALETLARRADDPAPGLLAAQRYRAELDRLRTRSHAKPKPVRLFYQVSPRPLFTLGGGHPVNEVFALCGATNVFADSGARALNIDVETLLARDPDAIVLGREPTRVEPELPPWRDLPGLRAARCEQVLAIDPDFLVRATPRMLEGAKLLCDWLDTVVRTAQESDCRPGGP